VEWCDSVRAPPRLESGVDRNASMHLLACALQTYQIFDPTVRPATACRNRRHRRHYQAKNSQTAWPPDA